MKNNSRCRGSEARACLGCWRLFWLERRAASEERKEVVVVWMVYSLAHQQVGLTYTEWDSPRVCEQLNACSDPYCKITYKGMAAGEMTQKGKRSLADRSSQHPCKC